MEKYFGRVALSSAIGYCSSETSLKQITALLTNADDYSAVAQIINGLLQSKRPVFQKLIDNYVTRELAVRDIPSAQKEKETSVENYLENEHNNFASLMWNIGSQSQMLLPSYADTFKKLIEGKTYLTDEYLEPMLYSYTHTSLAGTELRTPQLEALASTDFCQRLPATCANMLTHNKMYAQAKTLLERYSTLCENTEEKNSDFCATQNWQADSVKTILEAIDKHGEEAVEPDELSHPAEAYSPL